LQEGEILRYGLIIHEGRPQAYRERRYKMSSVKEILKSKGTQYWSISPKATAYEALQLMADKDIGAILVMEHDKVVGIFSERDYARKVILKGKSSKETMVGELMTSPVVAVTPADTLDRCMALMTVYKHRHLAVLDNGRVTGVISIGDVVNAVIITQKITIRRLHTGTREERRNCGIGEACIDIPADLLWDFLQGGRRNLFSRPFCRYPVLFHGEYRPLGTRFLSASGRINFTWSTTPFFPTVIRNSQRPSLLRFRFEMI
jgi:predicted transcriptional regulator